jgi:hypothetical protein
MLEDLSAGSLQHSLVANSSQGMKVKCRRLPYTPLGWKEYTAKCGKVFRMKQMGPGKTFCGFDDFLFCFTGADGYPLLVSSCTVYTTTFYFDFLHMPFSIVIRLLLVCVARAKYFSDPQSISVMSERGDPVSRRGGSAG